MAVQQIRVIRLSHVTYQHPNLQTALSFLNDFGLVEAGREGLRVFLRGYGVDPYIYVAEPSPDSKRHFLGASWVVDSAEDLEKAARHPDSSGIHDIDGPGGGRMVTLKDPNGFNVSFLYGQTLQEADSNDTSYSREKTPGLTSNTAVEKPRRGQFRRFQPGPSPVHKLGHYGYFVPGSRYQKTLEWYTTVMNLKPTDAVYDPSTGDDRTVFAHIDLGEEFTDHHSFFLGAGSEDKPSHVHHSSFEVNDFDTQTLGHDWLRGKGWTNCWGIGRHVLGSQIFDYWFDASGNILEHYSDGDLVNCRTVCGREPEAPSSLYIWGPNIPLAFATGRVEDAGKQLMDVELKKEPDVVQAKAAEVELRPLIVTA